MYLGPIQLGTAASERDVTKPNITAALNILKEHHQKISTPKVIPAKLVSVTLDCSKTICVTLFHCPGQSYDGQLDLR